ncbi:hypothetical protein VNO77_38993 [Canavalia gladiata]|uniref:Uncharacterized protein n=1 Tax=Canavalia gladiata TaxID=3824 RepID=A0AAN9KCT4_CANGL
MALGTRPPFAPLYFPSLGAPQFESSRLPPLMFSTWHDMSSGLQVLFASAPLVEVYLQVSPLDASGGCFEWWPINWSRSSFLSLTNHGSCSLLAMNFTRLEAVHKLPSPPGMPPSKDAASFTPMTTLTYHSGSSTMDRSLS